MSDSKKKNKGFCRTLANQKILYMVSIPFVVLVFIFNYLPIWGWTMAFQNYKPGRSFLEQEWVGFDHFIALFQDERFYLVFRNTLGMSFLGLLFGFTLPILFARSEEHTSELQSRGHLVCRLLLEKKKI